MNEARAIRLCIKHRDPAGFEFLVHQYRREAFGHALALLGNADDAADACQDSFSSAFASMPRLEELTAFYPWFYRILRNRCLNMLSRRKTEGAHRRREAGVDEPTDRSAESAVSRKQQQAEVWTALASLSTEHREILALKYLKGHDYAALAALLRIPRGTVMSRLYHARKAFQKAFLEQTGSKGSREGDQNHGEL